MKTSLEHLPFRKQRQLADVTETICEMAPVEMVILFGSHARGDWVDDPVGIHPETGPRVDFTDDPGVGYYSDFDVRSVFHKWQQCQGLETWMEKGGE